MEKTLALSFVLVIVVFATVYFVAATKGQRRK